MNLIARWICLSLIAVASVQAQTAPLKLERGDHVVLVGGTLPERFQHSGWLETYVHARLPQNQLVFRNLAVSGDEVVTRQRSENFGTPDDWLGRTGADVIWAFFGFNESFKGPTGVASFQKDLEKWVADTKAKTFSAKGPPRIILFSPIANEQHQNPNYADSANNNANIQLYAAAVAAAAKAQGVPFVELFAPSQKIFADAAAQKKSLTINGVHLGDRGDQLLAGVIFKALFGEDEPAGDYSKLRAVVNQKNAQWHARYRTIDGYNVYGGRSQMAYESGKGGPKITNYKVMQEEMTQRDVLTANRDKRVWALATGGDLAVDDSNLPPVTDIQSNKPGPNPDNTFPFLGGEEAIAKMTVHSGMKVNLFASEKEFPQLANPVQMAWDTRGRLWVSAWLNYPERTPTSKTGDSLLIFEDTDGDGKADKCTTFLDDLNAATGFQFYKDGVLVMQAPSLWYVRDTDGDDRGDTMERILMGMDSADSHHTANAICLDPGGSIYLSDGVFHRTQVETARGPVRNDDGGIFRFEPRTGRFETYVSYGFANPHGRAFDYWGNDIVTDATGNNNYFGAAFSGHIDYPKKHPGMKDFWNRPSRPCPATGFLTSRHFPDEFMGNFLNINVIGFQGIYRVKVTDEGSGLKGETMENLISSSDPNFRPIAISTGPDGAIYFCDWHNPIIGHLQHHLRDPNRDKLHGRIYRMTYEGRPLLKPVKIHAQPIPALLDLLKEPENQTRELAKVELGARKSDEVLAAVSKWMAALDKNDPNLEHHRMEALWVHQWHNVVNRPLLDQMLASPEPRARAAAARVLCYWRDRVPDALSLFKRLAQDAHPRVRLEAVRAASFYRNAEAAEVALAILKQPTDYYLDYTLKETLRQLEPYWRQAIAEGKTLAADNPAGVNHLVASVSATELLNLPRTAAVLEAILVSPGLADADRAVALDGLATERKMNRVQQLLALFETRSGDAAALANLARLLPIQLAGELKPARAVLAKLASVAPISELRYAAWAALIVADDSFDAAWNEAGKAAGSLSDLLHGIPLLTDPAFRAKAYARVQPLLAGLPAGLQTAAAGSSTGNGRHVRIELPRNGTLTLAEVQVFSGGQNIAPRGKAKQSSTSNSGEASRALDGRTDGEFASGTQTHTEENTPNPWWEVDLGGDYPIDSVAVWNRMEGDLRKRLEGFTLTLLDGGRTEVFRSTGNKAPEPTATIKIGGDPATTLRRAAIRALVSMNHEPGAVFTALAGLATKGDLIAEAAQGMRALPRASWPKDAAGQAAASLVAWAGKIPAAGRTAQDYVETIQFAGDLAGFLPAAEADRLRLALRELRVSVFVIRAVREQMRYDTPRIVVEAGKPFEIIFENGDFMPHNLVVARPGAREKIGEASALMKPDQTDGRGRPYVPNIPEVLSATKLIEAGQRVTLSLTAPNEEGDCTYVCTFPGHYQMMWGYLIVTKDVDAYLKAHPEAPPVGNGAAPAGHQHGKLE